MDCKLQELNGSPKKKRGNDRSSSIKSSHLSSVCFIPSHVVPKQKLAEFHSRILQIPSDDDDDDDIIDLEGI